MLLYTALAASGDNLPTDPRTDRVPIAISVLQAKIIRDQRGRDEKLIGKKNLKNADVHGSTIFTTLQ